MTTGNGEAATRGIFAFRSRIGPLSPTSRATPRGSPAPHPDEGWKASRHITLRLRTARRDWRRSGRGRLPAASARRRRRRPPRSRRTPAAGGFSLRSSADTSGSPRSKVVSTVNRSGLVGGSDSRAVPQGAPVTTLVDDRCVRHARRRGGEVDGFADCGVMRRLHEPAVAFAGMSRRRRVGHGTADRGVRCGVRTFGITALSPMVFMNTRAWP